MLAVIPLMIIAGLLVWRQSVLQPDAFERSLLQTPQALSVGAGRVAARPAATGGVPVLRDGRIRYVRTAGFETEVMAPLWQESAQCKGGPAVIFDRRGFIVGRWKDADKYAGRRVSADQLEQLK